MAVWTERDEDLESLLNRSSIWAITYGDVMSYLMVLFLLLFAYTYTKSVAGQFSAQAVENQFGKEGKAVEEIFSKRGIQQIARMSVNDERIRLSFQSPVLFDEGENRIKPDAVAPLTALAEALRELPNSVQIEGHTDNTPPGPHLKFHNNWELSSARAYAVLEFLIKHGVQPVRLSALGYGEYQPLEPNATAEGRARNRRIEINIIRRKTG